MFILHNYKKIVQHVTCVKCNKAYTGAFACSFIIVYFNELKPTSSKVCEACFVLAGPTSTSDFTRTWDQDKVMHDLILIIVRASSVRKTYL